MTTTTHNRHVHIAAPVEKVFDHVEDPRHFYAAWPERGRPTLSDVKLTPEGVGSTYVWNDKVFVFHIGGTMTRQECVPNERIVDHSSTGPVWIWTFEPDATGTTLSLACTYSTKVPGADKVIDRVGWNGDRVIDTILHNLKAEIEA